MTANDLLIMLLLWDMYDCLGVSWQKAHWKSTHEWLLLYTIGVKAGLAGWARWAMAHPIICGSYKV